MCLCKDHDRIRAQIEEKLSRPMNRGIPTLIRQAVDCHFFYNRSTLQACAKFWGIPDHLDLVTSVSEENIRLHWVSSPLPTPRYYHPCYEILKEGDKFEIIPNDKWFEWAEKAERAVREGKRPQNLVYDVEVIKHERDRRTPEPSRPRRHRQDDVIAREQGSRTTIENATQNSHLPGDPFTNMSAPDSDEPEHYKRFPCMKPWPGSRYSRFGSFCCWAVSGVASRGCELRREGGLRVEV